MAESLTVTATWEGGWATDVDARGHVVRVDEPLTVAGGTDTGMMPTELFLASLATCFLLALVHQARKRSLELPDLRVTVHALRAGDELRYDRARVAAAARIAPEEMDRLIVCARRVCWISNSLAAGIDIDYVRTSVETHLLSDTDPDAGEPR